MSESKSGPVVLTGEGGAAAVAFIKSDPGILPAHPPPLPPLPDRLDHGVVSYGRIPLSGGDGATVGALCASDRQPHAWAPGDAGTLEELATIARRMIDMERTLAHPDYPDPDRAARSGGARSEHSPEPRPLVTVTDGIADLAAGCVASCRRLAGLSGRSDEGRLRVNP